MFTIKALHMFRKVSEKHQQTHTQLDQKLKISFENLQTQKIQKWPHHIQYNIISYHFPPLWTTNTQIHKQQTCETLNPEIANNYQLTCPLPYVCNIEIIMIIITCFLSGLIYIQWRWAGVWVSRNRVCRKTHVMNHMNYFHPP